jgi:hypothetical protein
MKPASLYLVLVFLTVLALLPGCVSTGRLSVTSVPEGARILLNNIDNGTAPSETRDLPAGVYRVVLEKDGYVTGSRSVEVLPGGSSEVAMVLEAIPVPQDRREADGPTDISTGKVVLPAIVYYGGARDAGGGRHDLVIGKRSGNQWERYSLEGGQFTLAAPGGSIVQFIPDSPLYLEGIPASPGHWRITRKWNSPGDNDLDGNEQFIISLQVAGGQQWPPPGSVNLEFRPRTGPPLLLKL